MKEWYTILTADDSNASQTIVKEVFNSLEGNFQIVSVKNGLEAVERAREIHPDLILMDVIMPVMDGLTAIRELRKDPDLEHIPIIAMSSQNNLEKAFNAGANDFISKPFNYYELYLRARQALNLVENMNQIRNQNKILEQQQRDILDDLKYSKRIQNAILPSKAQIDKVLDEYFIFNLPKNIVSGDFYWIGQRHGKKVIGVADCTGHGISGSFLTIAGTAFLNEICNRDTLFHPNQILELLRERVMQLLQQKGDSGEAFDGMDFALCLIDTEHNKLEFSGANNPVYIVRKGELFVLPADRMPVGIHVNFSDPFTTKEWDLEEGDVIYMFSDGYPDQFGGPRGKKFRYRQFQELLTEIHQFPMEMQKEVLTNTFLDWKGDLDQVDDVMIFGFRYLSHQNK